MLYEVPFKWIPFPVGTLIKPQSDDIFLLWLNYTTKSVAGTEGTFCLEALFAKEQHSE